MSSFGRVAGLLQDLERRFVPPTLASDPDTARRAQLTVGLGLALAVTCPAFAAVSLFVYGLPVIAAIDIAAAALALAVPFVLMRTRSLALASSLALSVAVAAMTLAAASVEGLTSPALTWLVVVPIVASLVGGRRNASRWAIICVAVVLGFFALDRVLPNHELPIAARKASAAWNYVLMFATVAVFALMYERLHERTQAALAMATAELERAREQAALSERMAALTRLAVGVAHEINNPSTFVAGNVRLARDTVAQVRAGVTPYSELHEVEAALSDALLGAVRITETVRDLKTLGRAVDEGQARVDPAEVLDVALRIVSNQLRHKAIVEKNLQRVPAVLANESRLGQVLVNLLTNAADALPDRPINENLVRANTRMLNGRVCIEVIDNGVGIAPQAVLHVFDPFFTSKQVGKGAGLGLSISKNLIDQMNGTIEVESAVGQGTTFRVLLPPVDERPLAPSQPETGRRLRVLVIDDEELICTSLVRLLGRRHDVEYCVSAVEALARGDLERFDAVLCDLAMPGVSGVDFYERVVKEWPHLADRVGFLSGGMLTERIRRHAITFSARMVDKPFEHEKLDALLAALVGKSQELN